MPKIRCPTAPSRASTRRSPSPRSPPRSAPVSPRPRSPARSTASWSTRRTASIAMRALAIVTDKDADGLEVLRHSTAHLLAYAVKELFPDAQVTIGPVIEDGFYYDFSYKRPFTPEDLAAIEKRMAELAKRDEPVVRTADVARRGRRVLQGAGRALQGRDHRVDPGGRGHLAVRRRRSSPTCAAARTCRRPASSRCSS